MSFKRLKLKLCRPCDELTEFIRKEGGGRMITNFDYLKKEPKFSPFANVAISAEKIILMDAESSILNSRRAMEFAVKWMYSVDDALDMPYRK
jgi:type I restriction enzyme R subunit